MGRSVEGAGVLDKAMAVLGALESGPLTLAGLQAATGLSRATAHRLAVGLEAHGMVRREREGRFVLGPRLVVLGQAAYERFPWWEGAWPALERLRDDTGESVQLFVRDRDRRICVASLESPHGLRWIVPTGAVLPLDRGSAGRVLQLTSLRPHPDGAPSPGESAAIRPATTMWIESVEEREAGVASVSAPVVDGRGTVVAAVCVSGPLERVTTAPGRRYGARVVRAAHELAAETGLLLG